MTRTTYLVTVKLRPSKGGDTVVGVIVDDGLQDLWQLRHEDGDTRWVSSLDEFVERIELTRDMLEAAGKIMAGQRPGGLSDAEWEWVRLHPFQAVAR